MALECCVVINVFSKFKNIFSKNHYSFINFKIYNRLMSDLIRLRYLLGERLSLPTSN